MVQNNTAKEIHTNNEENHLERIIASQKDTIIAQQDIIATLKDTITTLKAQIAALNGK